MSEHLGDRLRAAFGRAMDQPPTERVAWARATWADAPELLELLVPMLEDADQAAGFLEPPEATRSADVSTVDAGDKAQPALDGRTVADRYEIERRLGAGGAGVVYAARDRLTDTRVAVKALSTDAGSPDARREAATLRLLRLPGVLHLLDDGREHGYAYIVTELVDGEPFPACETPCAWADIERLVVALLETLGRIHWAGVVHRDIKPHNVLVTRDGLPVVLDLGVSESSRPEERSRTENRYAGTLRYMAPEQIRKGAWSARSDLYAVGAMVHEALSGTPFRSDPDAVFAGAGVRPAAAPPLADVAPGVPPAVASVIDRLLRNDPDGRPRSSHEVLRALPGLSVSDGAPALERAGSPEALRALFHGPDRIHHLREDGATELWRRTHGDPDEMRSELGAWARAGLGRFEAGRFLIERPALQRLRSELRLRTTTSGSEPLEPDDVGEFGRLIRVLATDDAARISEEAGAIAVDALDSGDPASASVALTEGLRVVRQRRDVQREAELLALLLRAALLDGTRGSLDHMLYDLSRATPTPAVEEMQAVARGALRALDGEAEAALIQVPDPRGIDDAVVRRSAVAARLFAVRHLDSKRQRELVAEAKALAEELQCPSIEFAALSASAWLAYLDDEYDEAAARHVDAMERAVHAASRMSSMLNAASAFLEASRFDRAEALAREARAYFRERRHAQLETRSEWILRAAAYRRGDGLEPDIELAAASRLLGTPNLAALVHLGEAALAWRAGQRVEAIGLATHAARFWREVRSPWAALLADALSFAAGSNVRSGADLIDACDACPMPRVTVQVAGLVGTRDAALHSASMERVETAAGQVSTDSSVRLEILSVDEARQVGGRAS